MRLILIGLVAGFFSALFGVGGGIIIVPLLLLVARWEMRSATATSLAAIGITATAGVVAYRRSTATCRPSYALLLGVPAAAGALGGATLQQRVHARTLSYLFAALLVGNRRRTVPQVTYVLAVVLGVVAGILSGLFGVGGGILFVPTLTWLGLTQLHAEATSLLAIIPTVLVGVWRQQRYGNVRWRGALVHRGRLRSARPSAAPPWRSRCRSRLLRKLFAGVLILTAAQIAWRARGKRT